MAVTVIPFDAGQHQGISKNLLPVGQFALVENGQLDRDGRIRPRCGFTQQASTSYGSGTFVGYDLFAYNDRLIALGDRLSKGFPTDFFEFTQGVGAAAWRPTDPDSTQSQIRLPPATRVRDLGSPPEQEGGVDNFGCAASAGFTTLVYNATGFAVVGYAHIINPATDQTICIQRFDGQNNTPRLLLRAVALAAKVWVLGSDTIGTSLNAQPFTYATDESFNTAVGGLYAIGSGIRTYDVTKVAGADQFVTAVNFLDSTIRIKKWTNAAVDTGVSFANITATDVFSIAVEADSVSNTLTVTYVTFTNVVSVRSYNLTTGAQIGAGPFTPSSMSGKTATKVGICRKTTTTVAIVADITSDTEPSLYTEDYNPATNAFTLSDIVRDAQLASAPIIFSGMLCVAIRYGAANTHQSPNILIGIQRSTVAPGTGIVPIISKDLEIADSTSSLLPNICTDSTSGRTKYYWANGIVNTGEARPGSVNSSVDPLPLVTEFELGSTDRRQAAQLANVLYLTGGCPVLFDGRQAFEQGFHARPRIISIASTAAVGGLINGAEYDYRYIWEALDSDRNVHRSSVSSIFTSKLGAAQVQGTAILNPLPASFVGTTLTYSDGTTTFSVTFNAFSSDDIVNQINAQSKATLLAYLDGNQRLVIRTLAGGTSTAINISGGTARASLGLSLGTVGGSANTTNALVCTTPHSMRCSVGVRAAGGSVRLKAYRSLATVTKTQAVITGSLGANPPSPSINGKNLLIFTDPVTAYNVVFGPTDITSAQICATINAVTAGIVLASDAGGAIRLTRIAKGADTYIVIYPCTASGPLGFTENEQVNGTTTFTKGENFQLCGVNFVGPSSAVKSGSYVTITDTLSDDDLASQELLYTAVESPLGHHAPPPHDYNWAGKERINTGGQPRGDRWTVTKLLTQANPACYAQEGTTGFSNRLVGNIEGVLVEGDSNTYFTRRKIWRVSGRGPEVNGVGEFFAADEVDSAGGMRVGGWKSLCKAPKGTFFQLADDKLYMLVAGGVPQWIGQPVRDTLALFPNIVAAAHFTQRQAVVFACQNTAGTQGVLLVYDLRREIWTQDVIGPVTALAEFNGRVAYLSGGNVFLEDLTAGIGTFVPLTVTLGSFIGFGPMGWGAIQKVLLLGTYRGDVNIEAQISYDDGKTWVTLGNFDVTAANGYVTDAPVQLEFVPAIQDCSRFALRFLETFAGTNSEGVWLNALELHHSQNPGSNKLGSAYTR